MNKDLEKQLVEACRQNWTGKTTSLGAEVHKADTARYRCQQRFQDELNKVFNILPSMLLHSSELAEPDSFQPVATALGSLIVSRDASGKVHLFRNSCRHRGARLVKEKQCARRMICPYHAWSYATDGQLSNIPGQSHCFPGIDKENNGLITVPCAEKYGFIWLCPGAEEGSSAETHLDKHLGEMAAHLQWLAPQQLKFFQRTSKIWNGNWKLFAEGGLETYHFAFAHKATIAPYFFNNTAVIDQLGAHFRVVMPTRELESVEAKAEAQSNTQAKVQPSLRDCTHTLLFLSPGSALLVQKAHVDWIQFRPIAVDKTEISVTSLIPAQVELDNPEQRAHWQKNHHITNLTLDEDWSLGESIQQTVGDQALPHIQYGKNEWALQAFNAWLDKRLRSR